MKAPAIVTLDTCVHIYFTEHSAAFVAETLVILSNAYSWMIQHSDIYIEQTEVCLVHHSKIRNYDSVLQVMWVF